MAFPRPALLVAAALAAMVVSAAAAGTDDAKAIRSVASQYVTATHNGSSVACQMMTPNAQAAFVYLASGFAKKKQLSSCPAAVAAVAKMNEAQFPTRAAYDLGNKAELRALARAKVTVHGNRATLYYTYKSAFVSASSSINFASVNGGWLVDS